MARWRGAETIGAYPGLLEMWVGRPPLTCEGALDLAKEQYLYRNDIVIQGAQTLQTLAAELLGGTARSF